MTEEWHQDVESDRKTFGFAISTWIYDFLRHPLYLYLFWSVRFRSCRFGCRIGKKLSGFFGAKTKTPGVLRRADIAKIFDEINKNYICSMKRQNALYQMHLILYNIIYEEITDNKLIYTYLFCLWQNLPIRSINLREANIPFLIFLVDYCQALWSLKMDKYWH